MLKEQLQRSDLRAKELENLRTELEKSREEQTRYTNQLESTCKQTNVLNDALQQEVEILKAETMKSLQDKEQLQNDVLTASDYIVNLEDKCFTANKTSVELL